MISPKNRMIDLSQYEVLEKLRTVQYSKFYLISNIETGKKFLAKYHTGRRDRNLRDYFFDLSRELRILSKINHGYSLTDFKNNENPVIILNELLEYLPNCEISQENLNSELQSHQTLNSTQKLIIIYGIAAGMSYLHSYNVIHRNLNSSVIFLDGNYYPKILRLDHSKEMNRNEEFSVEMKPKYYEKHHAPEYLLNSEFSKASDVYSFGLILYSIISDINHPSILNFVGYGSFDFKGRSIPVIITENASNGTLDKILEFDKNNDDDDFILDDTKKLILIYGIASALSYLHSHDVIHCSLNPTNIFVDDFLFPKITGFYWIQKAFEKL